MTRLEPGTYHVPVMLAECMNYLAVREGGTYVDATLGGGGHTAELLQRVGPSGRVISFDADEAAIEHCTQRFGMGQQGAPPLELIHANFDTMPTVISTYDHVDGVLFDLGVSSYQFDFHERGFSFRQQAPLDMRFTPSGPTAADLLNSSSPEAIRTIFRDFGEEPMSRKLADAVVRRRTLAPIRTTGDLRDVVITNIPPQHQPKTLARIFQALRIAVNDELGRLERVLQDVLPLLSTGGRCVVMSYHSLEDRIVKNVMRDAHNDGIVQLITKKPVEASSEEISRNPRARSARLRACERIFAA